MPGVWGAKGATTAASGASHTALSAGAREFVPSFGGSLPTKVGAVDGPPLVQLARVVGHNSELAEEMSGAHTGCTVLSVEAKEFVPSSTAGGLAAARAALSSRAKEFVPRRMPLAAGGWAAAGVTPMVPGPLVGFWMQPAPTVQEFHENETPVLQPNLVAKDINILNLNAFSDDEEKEEQPSSECARVAGRCSSGGHVGAGSGRTSWASAARSAMKSPAEELLAQTASLPAAAVIEDDEHEPRAAGRPFSMQADFARLGTLPRKVAVRPGRKPQAAQPGAKAVTPIAVGALGLPGRGGSGGDSSLAAAEDDESVLLVAAESEGFTATIHSGFDESTELGREEGREEGEDNGREVSTAAGSEAWLTPEEPAATHSDEAQRVEEAIEAAPGGTSLLASPQYLPEELLCWRAAARAEDLWDENVRYSVATAAEVVHFGEPRLNSHRRGRGGGAQACNSGSAQAGACQSGSGETPPAWPEDAARAQARQRQAQHDDVPLAVRRAAKAQKALRVSSKSAEGNSDAEVVRQIKCILNKLTVEKFSPLYQQLVRCGISTNEHVEVLMREVFERATTQHHFIGMYADLCAQLHRWFIDSEFCGDGGRNFKRILLNQCQSSFEQNLKPQGDLAHLEADTRKEIEHRHKTRMLGNLRFVGALLEKGMLASKILGTVVDELLTEPTAVSLECISVFLTAIGPAFDRPDWAHHAQLKSAFHRVQDMSQQKDIPPRVRCLLKDVLDLRASGWQNRKKAVRTAGEPMTLDAVLRRAEEETGETLVRPAPGGGGCMGRRG